MQAFGIQAADTQIADFAGRRALVVERFDRRRTRDQRLLRLPQEDCCQALSVPPTLKYQSDGGPGIRQIAGLLKGSDTPAKDQMLFLKAQVVLWLLAATDGHAKNFSIHLATGGRFHLAPLYDVVSAQPSIDANDVRHNQAKLAMSIGKNRHYVLGRILPRHFLQTAGSARNPASQRQRDAGRAWGHWGGCPSTRCLPTCRIISRAKIATSIAEGAKARLEQIGVQAMADRALTHLYHTLYMYVHGRGMAEGAKRAGSGLEGKGATSQIATRTVGQRSKALCPSFSGPFGLRRSPGLRSASLDSDTPAHPGARSV